MIPLFKVHMSPDAGQAVKNVLNSGYIGEGDKVAEFENVVGKIICNDNVLALNSCTSSIMMSLRLAGVENGDYVISTPMTCLATNEPILALGATPIWCDVDSCTGNMTADKLVTALQNNHHVWDKIKAIICVHWAGNPCDVVGINEVAKRYNIPVIEDAAQAFGASINEKMIGTHSDYVCFSFQAIKYITAGDGGIIAFKSYEEKERARLMRWYGLDRTLGNDMRCSQDPVEYGYKFHMNNINAAIGLSNIKCLDKLLLIARKNAKIYYDAFSSFIAIADYDDGGTYWIFTLLVNNPENFIKVMKEKGIACSQVHGRNDTKSIFIKSYNPNLLGVSTFSNYEVCIPCGWWVEEEEVKHIVSCVKEYLKGD